MKKILMLIMASTIFTITTFAEGLTPFVGIAMHYKALEKVDTKASSPLGLFGVRYEMKYAELFYKHISSIPDVGAESKGLNLMGAQAKYSYEFIDVYAGAAWHSEEFDGHYYSEQFSEFMYKGGMRVNYDTTRLFFEYISSADSKKADLFMYGIEWVFYPDDLKWE